MNNSDRENKRGRIIIRNLPYKADENAIKEFFKDYGAIKELKLLQNADGKSKGVGFMQFSSYMLSLKAIKEKNLSRFMGRRIVMDFAVPKHEYQRCSNNTEIKQEKDAYISIKTDPFEDMTGEVKIKMEPTDEEDKFRIKNEDNFDPSLNVIPKTEIKMDDGSSDDGVEVADSDIEDEEMSENSMSGTEDEDEEKSKNFEHKPVSKDVLEGRTIFLSNLSTSLQEEEVSERLSQFGRLKYVIFCRDKYSSRFKGTAFVQFVDKNSAEKCIQSWEDPLFKDQFVLGGRRIRVSQALGREDIASRAASRAESKVKTKVKEDKRNIFLAREGVVREGTKAASDVSRQDLALRKEREIIKRRILANLNVFVSPVRLYICNLPIQLTDKELRDIFKKYTSQDSIITECKIMKNLYDLDDAGNPKSKGHGFVTFSQHKHALEALRTINNNPDIFTMKKRPILEFSLENRAALKAKENRMKISKEKNTGLKTNSKVPVSVNKDKESNEGNPFMGSNYDPKKKGLKALHSHIGPKIRHRDRKKNVKITRNKINHQIQRGRNNSKSSSTKTKGKKTSTSKGSAKSKFAGKSKKSKTSTQKPKAKKKKFIQ